MKRNGLALTVLAAGLAWLAPASSPAAWSGGPLPEVDVDALVRSAGETFDLSASDAVVLMESRTVDLSTPGERRTTVHRIVRVATEIGIGAYADVRVPHRAAEGALRVLRLRTWRDGRWWPHETAVNPTAVVETLPFALQSADDYTDRRETMLLHDGVELPCVLEVAYTTVERLAPGSGDDGLVVLAGDDPALAREFTLVVAPGTGVTHAEGNGAPAPRAVGLSVQGDGRSGAETRSYDALVWRMAPAPRLPHPLVADAATVAPYAVWSTWPDWDALAEGVSAPFGGAAELSSDLRDSLAAALHDAPTPRSKAAGVAELVNDGTRLVDYAPAFWPGPRPAARTWATAYGHRLDRAVLAAALFREAGLEATPCFVTGGPGRVDADVPGLARFGGLSLLVRGDGFEGVYDPEAGEVTDGTAPFFGRAVWVAAPGRTPEAPSGADGPSAVRIILTLEPGEDGAWTGTGFYDASGALSPHHEIAGLSGEAGRFLGGVAGALEGAEASDPGFERLDPDRATAGFTLALAAPEPDDRGRIALTLGEPAGGLIDALPADVRLFEERRGSPVILAGPMEQSVELRLTQGEREAVLLPTDLTLENAVGGFVLTVGRTDDRITVTRTLRIDTARVEAADWPLLRALLLAETDARSTAIYLK